MCSDREPKWEAGKYEGLQHLTLKDLHHHPAGDPHTQSQMIKWVFYNFFISVFSYSKLGVSSQCGVNTPHNTPDWCLWIIIVLCCMLKKKYHDFFQCNFWENRKQWRSWIDLKLYFFVLFYTHKYYWNNCQTYFWQDYIKLLELTLSKL